MKQVGKTVLFGAVGVGLCVYLYVQMAGPRGIPSLLDKWQQIETLQKENAGLETDNLRRRESIDRLQNDQEAQQFEILKRLKKQRKGTVDFYLPKTGEPQEDEPNSPETTP